MFGRVAYNLKMREFGANDLDVLLEVAQFGVRVSMGMLHKDMFAEMPSLDSTVPRQVLVEILFLEPVKCGLECLESLICIQVELPRHQSYDFG